VGAVRREAENFGSGSGRGINFAKTNNREKRVDAHPRPVAYGTRHYAGNRRRRW